MAEKIDHNCQLPGDALQVGNGTELDGVFGRDKSPYDLDTIADLKTFVGILSQRGYSDADLEAITHGNFLALLQRAWA